MPDTRQLTADLMADDYKTRADALCRVFAAEDEGILTPAEAEEIMDHAELLQRQRAVCV